MQATRGDPDCFHGCCWYVPGCSRLATPHRLSGRHTGYRLAASSAAAINHLLDHRIDAKMARTKRRPLASGKLTERNVLVFALALGLLAMLVLVLLVNALTAVLTFLSLIGYAIVYTVWLKRATPQNIVIGGAAGAAPPVLGWTAVTGSLDPQALLLFLIIFIWTPPHFLGARDLPQS